MSWLSDIKKQKSEEDKKRMTESALLAKRVREKAKEFNSMIIKLLEDFGKACWGEGLFSQSYTIQEGLRGQGWLWKIEHIWDEHGIAYSAGLEVHLEVDPRTDEFEFMLVEPETLSDVGPRCPCSQEELKTMLRDTYASWLKESSKHNLKR